MPALKSYTCLKCALLGLFTLLLFSAQAKEPPPRPNPPRLVNDFAGLLDQNQTRALENKLRAYNDSTSTQIAIVAETSLKGDDLFDYSFRLAESWGIGQKGKDNGILIYIAVEDRKMGIHVGPGLQHIITDAIAKRIINNVLRPAFRQNNYYGGLDHATDILIQLASGTYQNDQRGTDDFPWQIIVLIIIVIIIILANRNDGGGYYRDGKYEDYGRRRRRGGGWIILGDPFGGFGRGGGGFGGGFGGGGGGGFGGFGGGGFDGGGAFGDW
ncbi:MAG: TPM domain-containing protein [Bacteroidetes bacterium]|nr:MAG: TPM domain-containing protein [Bacteroidota bacterium]